MKVKTQFIRSPKVSFTMVTFTRLLYYVHLQMLHIAIFITNSCRVFSNEFHINNISLTKKLYSKSLSNYYPFHLINKKN